MNHFNVYVYDFRFDIYIWIENIMSIRLIFKITNSFMHEVPTLLKNHIKVIIR